MNKEDMKILNEKMKTQGTEKDDMMASMMSLVIGKAIFPLQRLVDSSTMVPHPEGPLQGKALVLGLALTLIVTKSEDTVDSALNLLTEATKLCRESMSKLDKTLNKD